MIINLVLIFTLLISSCKADNEKKIENVSGPMQEVQYPVEYIMGQFDPSKHEDFTVIPQKYADRDSMFLRKDAMDAFIKMYEAALLDGVKLVIRSATRNFNSQKSIWERKWNGSTILSDGINAAKDIPIRQNNKYM